MTGLINLISEYSSRLAILPILAVMNIIITVIIHFINNKKIIKYIPSIIIGLGAIVIGIYSISFFTSPRGLNTAWIAVFLATSALVGIFTGIIIDLIVSLGKNLNYERKTTNKKTYFKAKRKRNKEWYNGKEYRSFLWYRWNFI